MKTHEQMFDEWFAEMQSKADASGLTNDDIKAGVIQFARRVAEEQKERDAKLCETLELREPTEAEEQVYVRKFCRGSEIPMAFHADRLAAAIRQQESLR